MKCNAQSCPNNFSLNVYVLAVVFCQQIYKKTNNFPEIVGFLKTVVELQSTVLKRLQKNN